MKKISLLAMGLMMMAGCATAQDILLPAPDMIVTMTLMETRIAEGTFPQCFAAVNRWNGRFVAFMPGHRPEAAANPALIGNVAAIIDYLLQGSRQ